MARASTPIFRIAQDDLEIKDDLSPYVGQWVATRRGYYVASHRDPVRLRKNPLVHPGDTFVAVSHPPSMICLY